MPLASFPLATIAYTASCGLDVEAATHPLTPAPYPHTPPSQLLLASGLTPEQRELADTILESGNTLLTILGDILDFSKVGWQLRIGCHCHLASTVHSSAQVYVLARRSTAAQPVCLPCRLTTTVWRWSARPWCCGTQWRPPLRWWRRMPVARVGALGCIARGCWLSERGCASRLQSHFLGLCSRRIGTMALLRCAWNVACAGLELAYCLDAALVSGRRLLGDSVRIRQVRLPSGALGVWGWAGPGTVGALRFALPAAGCAAAGAAFRGLHRALAVPSCAPSTHTRRCWLTC